MNREERVGATLCLTVLAAVAAGLGRGWGQGLLGHEPAPAPGTTIKRNPIGANVNSNGPTTVFITFSGLTATKVPDEAVWCSELVVATAPEIGNKCRAGTVLGRLPERFDQSKLQGGGVFTDIMALPSSVSRRARQLAQAGHVSTFFYVRKFRDTSGAGAHEYTTVTCHMSGSGAGLGLSLSTVRLYFKGHDDNLILAVRRGEPPPPVEAALVYNGSGRLRGRWEVAFPGETKPSSDQLKTEGSLTRQERSQQQRFTLIERFDEFLPPTGQHTVEGPDPELIPTSLDGQHLLLLRIEASDDKEANVDLARAGAGAGIEAHGGVAAFSIPALRYMVGTVEDTAQPGKPADILALSPRAGTPVLKTRPIEFKWSPAEGAVLYRLTVMSSNDKPIWTAIVDGDSTSYSAPAPRKRPANAGPLRWQVVAENSDGQRIAETSWQVLTLAE